jgi:hypothetical protein
MSIFTLLRDEPSVVHNGSEFRLFREVMSHYRFKPGQTITTEEFWPAIVLNASFGRLKQETAADADSAGIEEWNMGPASEGSIRSDIAEWLRCLAECNASLDLTYTAARLREAADAIEQLADENSELRGILVERIKQSMGE